MKYLTKQSLSSLVIAIMVSTYCAPVAAFSGQENKPKDDRGLGLRPNSTGTTNQAKSGGSRPEIVLQAGITSPQTQIAFSRDGRLLASIGINGSVIKLWEVASGRLLRQIESSTPSFGGNSLTRPFRFSADGRTLIIMSEGNFRRWDVETGRELPATRFSPSRDSITTLFSEDGRIFASVGLKRDDIRLWDTTSGRELTPIKLDEDENVAGEDCLALSGDGSLLALLTESVKASAGRKGVNMSSSRQITIFDVASGKQTRTLKLPTVAVQYGPQGMGGIKSFSLAFTSDSAWIAFRDETSMKIWETASGREVKSFGTPTISASDPGLLTFADTFLFSPDRRLISVVTGSNKSALLDAASGVVLRELTGHNGAILGISFSADSKLIATSSIDNRIKIWDTATGREIQSLSGAAAPISDIALTADGKSLSIAGHESVTMWELSTGGVQRGVVLPDEYARPRQYGLTERGGFLSRDGRLIIAGSSKEPLVKVWEARTGKELATVSLSAGKELGNVTFNGDGSAVALIEKNKQSRQTGNPQSPQQPQNQPMPNIPAQGVPMTDMTKVMEEMRKDPKKMQEQMKKMQEQMKKVQEAMNKGDYSAGMAVLESLGIRSPIAGANKPSNPLRVFDAVNGQQLKEIPLTLGPMIGQAQDHLIANSVLSFSPDGRILASTIGFSAPISLRDISSGQELISLKPKISLGVQAISWSADSQKLASAHWTSKRNLYDQSQRDNFSLDDMIFTINVWDAKTGNETLTLPGHNNFITRLAFSRDGAVLASGGIDSTIKLWDLGSGKELHTLKGHGGSIAAIDFSADGRFVVSGSEDGSTRLWNAQTGDLLATMVSLNKGDDWLVVTPDGLFDGSPAGWNQILWRFSPNTFDVSPVEIFFNEYYYPGLLPDIIAGKKVTAAADISQKDRRQPRVSIEAPDSATGAISTRTLKVKVNITEAPAGAQDVRLFRNGSLVKVWRGDVLKGQSTAVLETTISVVAGQNRLTAYAFNRDNVKSSDASLAITGADSLKRPATLHILAVGLNQYANPGYNLKYAGADARAFAEEVERQQKKLTNFEQIQTTSLFDGDATKANILYALRRLAGSQDALPGGAPAPLEKIKAAEPEDAVVIFYAGHGTAQDQRFYLIPHDLGYTGARTELTEAGLKSILSHSVSDLELEQACEGMNAGHLLMVIDACNSGQALEAEEKRRGPMNSKGLAQLAYEKGMYILTAAQSYQAAMEAEQLGHGYLTYALVEEGLKSPAADAQPRDGLVAIREWLDYATDRVPRMQESKMKEGRGLKHSVAFVEGEEKVDEVDKRNVQRPRVFYRREFESKPMIIARP